MLSKRLCFGDTIGIVSPASPAEKESIIKGINFLKSKGFNVICGKNIYKNSDYLAGSDKERATDIMEMFQNKNVDMILCIRGGYGSARIIPYLDIDIIKENPKIFMGFSDITVLLNYFNEKCNLITFHGPMLTSITLHPLNFKSFINSAINGNCPYLIDISSSKYIVPGSAEGILAGGNLSIICSSFKTPYEVNLKDKILFLEEVDEEPYKLDRMLNHLFHSNKIDSLKGIILGQFTNKLSSTIENKYTEILYSFFSDMDIPVISNIFAGHNNPNITLPLGAKVKIDSKKNSILVQEKVVYDSIKY